MTIQKEMANAQNEHALLHDMACAHHRRTNVVPYPLKSGRSRERLPAVTGLNAADRFAGLV